MRILKEYDCWQLLYGSEEFNYKHVYLKLPNPYKLMEGYYHEKASTTHCDYGES